MKVNATQHQNVLDVAELPQAAAPGKGVSESEWESWKKLGSLGKFKQVSESLNKS